MALTAVPTVMMWTCYMVGIKRMANGWAERGFLPAQRHATYLFPIACTSLHGYFCALWLSVWPALTWRITGAARSLP